MSPLSADDLRRLREQRHEVGFGWQLVQAEVDRLRDEWALRVSPNEHDTSETFALARPDGSLTGAVGPRWLCHLLGLSHRAAHIGLSTPNGMVVVQRRAATKLDWPDAWDMAVAGHVPQNDDGSPMTFQEGAWKEAEEEIGLSADNAHILLLEGALLPIGATYFSFDRDAVRNPPRNNAEVRQLYGATLTPDGLARLAPDYEELAGVYICPVEEAFGLLERDDIASGLRHSLPRYLDWLVRRATA